MPNKPNSPRCKICQAAVKPRHVKGDITYYYCSACDFLQNYYLEKQPNAATQQQHNDTCRTDKWDISDLAEVRRKAWEVLDQMTWPIAWWSRQAHSLLQNVPSYHRLVRAQVKHRLPKILDFGTGHGTAVLELRRHDNLNITGLDPFSPTDDPVIDRRYLSEAKYPSASFDGIFAIETMEHIANVLETFAEINRILKPGGVFLIQTRRLEDPEYQRSQSKWFYLEDPKTHVSIYSETALRRIAELTGWSKVEFRGTRIARFTK